MKILETNNLKKYYGTNEQLVKALDGVSISIEKGKFIAIVGPSGSGKSTLLNMIGGLDKPDSGEVVISGKTLSTLTEEELTIFRRRNIGFVFQDYNLISSLNVYENICLPFHLDGNTVDVAYLEEITKYLGISDKLGNMANDLSGGQKQRVAIARALITKPSIVLADEPTGNLDTKMSVDVVGLLKSLSNKFSQTIIMITHDIELANMADEIIEIRDGIIAGGVGFENTQQ